LTSLLKKFGPGFLFAGAAIGVSHLVQSTRAGADFGFGLIWALLLINFIKYPFFQFGPRYASGTGENLLQGYAKLGQWVIVTYFLISFATMFTIQTAVTIVTAGIASSLFNNGSIVLWTTIITSVCFFILLLGRYQLLDSLMKYIVIVLTISTIIAVILATQSYEGIITATQTIPEDAMGIAFLIAFMGWMPAPLDITIWQSIWTVEKKKLNPSITTKQYFFDFNVGYLATIILGLGFISLGALVMFNSGEKFSSNGTQFANQLISMYTLSLGDWSKIIIGIAALTTMFSTTLTTLDASPRVMQKSSELIFQKSFPKGYLFWLLILIFGTLSIYFFFVSEMGLLIEIATVLSFLTAPFYAILSYWLLTSKHTPEAIRPSKMLRMYSIFGILLLIAFSIWYLSSLL
jgi:Mn2+/Fe2+ NRAMP family transporter